MKSLAVRAAAAALGLVTSTACRDWEAFEPSGAGGSSSGTDAVSSGGGAAPPSGSGGAGVTSSSSGSSAGGPGAGGPGGASTTSSSGSGGSGGDGGSSTTGSGGSGGASTTGTGGSGGASTTGSGGGGGGSTTGAGGSGGSGTTASSSASASSSSASSASASSSSASSTSASSGAGGGGGGGGDDCGTIDVLSDEFDGADFDWRWQAPDTAHFAIAGGSLVVSYPMANEGFQIETSAGFDLRGRTMVLELTTPPEPGQGLWFDVANDLDSYFEFFLNPLGTLEYVYDRDGDYVTFASDPFDPVDDRFWRFRESGGTMFFDTSPDGSTWLERADFPTAGVIDPAYAFVFVGGGASSNTPAGEARIERIYSGEPSAAHTCPIDTLQDDFDDGVRASVWEGGWDEPLCPVVESGGLLRFECEAAAYQDSAYGSMTAFDLVGSSVTVEIVEYPEAGSNAFMALFVARAEEGNGWSFEVDEGFLVVYELLDGSWSTVELAGYDPVDARFLRIREAGGRVYFDHSPDGVTFIQFEQRTPTVPLTEMQVYLGGGSSNDTTPVNVAFDNLNLGP